MADNQQFGKPKGAHFGGQFGDRAGTGAGQGGDPGHCGQCEAMLADALDGTLSAADQALFDSHMTLCGPCAQMLADARRGAAWLEMLRDPRPEPPAELLERILAQTSGSLPSSMQVPGLHASATAAAFPSIGPHLVGTISHPAPASAFPAVINHRPASDYRPGVLPFPRRVVAALRVNTIGQIMAQPRLAMTAAMAFFSIALTLNLTGVRVQDLRAADLRPGSLQRDFYSATARAVQYYDGLRVVYELESRVHDLESTSGDDAPAGSQPVPASTVAPKPASAQPSGNHPATPEPQRKRAAPGNGTSLREPLIESRRLVAEGSGSEAIHIIRTVRETRVQA